MGENPMDETMGNQQATREEIAWLAGLWDGEGSIGVRTNIKIHQVSPRIAVYNSNTIIINKAIEILEKMGLKPYVSIKNDGVGRFPGSKKDVYQVQIGTYKGAKPFLDQMIPFLVGKKSNAQLLLRFVDSRLRFDRSQSNRDKAYNEQEVGMIEAIYKQNGDQRGTSQTIRDALLNRQSIRSSRLRRSDDIVGPCVKAHG